MGCEPDTLCFFKACSSSCSGGRSHFPNTTRSMSLRTQQNESNTISNGFFTRLSDTHQMVKINKKIKKIIATTRQKRSYCNHVLVIKLQSYLHNKKAFDYITYVQIIKKAAVISACWFVYTC